MNAADLVDRLRAAGVPFEVVPEPRDLQSLGRVANVLGAFLPTIRRTRPSAGAGARYDSQTPEMSTSSQRACRGDRETKNKKSRTNIAQSKDAPRANVRSWSTKGLGPPNGGKAGPSPTPAYPERHCNPHLNPHLPLLPLQLLALPPHPPRPPAYSTGVTFADVAGCDPSKQELEEVVDFLKKPMKYAAVGAKVERPATHPPQPHSRQQEQHAPTCTHIHPQRPTIQHPAARP
eukprot:scaffold314_cov108-Isochrysis_galbana.AAC.8